MNTQPPSILVGTRNRTVCVRVEGRGSFLNSTGLKEFAREMTNRGYREFVLDLKICDIKAYRSRGKTAKRYYALSLSFSQAGQV